MFAQLLCELIQMNNSDYGEWSIPQYSEMRILADYITGSTHNGAIYKFVVIRVLLYKAELKIRVFPYDVGRASDDLYK